jgi:hypothetical protein
MSEGLLVCLAFLVATELEAVTELLRPVVCGGEKRAELEKAPTRSVGCRPFKPQTALLLRRTSVGSQWF